MAGKFAWLEKLGNILQDYGSDYSPADVIFTALCTYGLCSDTAEAEQVIISYLQTKAKHLADLSLIWSQATFAYLWHKIDPRSAKDWEKYHLDMNIPLFTYSELDQLRKAYICQTDFSRNLCRILLNLESSIDLAKQMDYLNTYERQLIKVKLPRLAELANLNKREIE